MADSLVTQPPQRVPGLVSTLPNWFGKITQAGVSGFNSKTVVLWGDSQISNATTMVGGAGQPTVTGGEIAQYQFSGEVLAGTTFLNYGNNGITLATALVDGCTYGISAVIAAAPDLIVLRWGTNDVRLGGTNLAQLKALLTTAVLRLRSSLPNTDIVLWGPNAFLSDDPGSTSYVSPLGSAQAYSTILYQAYAAMQNVWPNVVVIQNQDIFGLTCQPSSVAGPGNANGWMVDILHANPAGQIAETAQLASVLGFRQPFSTLQAALARASNPTQPWLVYPRELEDSNFYTLIAQGRFSTQGGLGSNGFIDYGAPGPASANIDFGDIVNCGFGGSSFQIPTTASIINQTSTTTRISNLGASLPPVMTGGMVSVYRPKYGLDSLGNVQLYISQTGNFPSRRRYYIGDAGTNYIRIRTPPGDNYAWPTTFTNGDSLIIPGLAPITSFGTPAQYVTTAMQLGPTGSFASYIGQPCWLFSATPGRS